MHRPKIAAGRKSRGFTLPELLVSMSIIGVLATTSMVGMSSVRVKARDLKRVSDMGQLHTALELYNQAHGGYPNDGAPGLEGTPIGNSAFNILSDAGWGSKIVGTVFMEGVPENPQPFGLRYVYRSLNSDGSDCVTENCASYSILFSLEKGNGELAAGPHAMTGVGVKQAEGFSKGAMTPTEISGTAAAQARVDSLVATSTDAVVTTLNSDQVKKANEYVVAPAVAVSTAVNAAYASSHFGGYLFFFLTQPASLFGMRRRKNWGVVFNAVSHMPVDLAIVRLRRNSDGRIVQSTVTDAEGRYSFLVHPGAYRIEVSKVGLVFPSIVDMSIDEDAHYHDLYHGGTIEVTQDATILTQNIPVDPDGIEQPDAVVLKTQSKKMLHKSIALISPVFGGVVFAMRPSVFVALLFAAEIVTYFLFKRLAEPGQMKNWGTVFHQVTEEPVPKAVVRIFSARFNKLLDTQVTDLFGRYHFRVMDNVYYLTVTKEGFRKTETEPIDLVGSFTPIIIASDLPLAPIEGGIIMATRKKPPADGTPKKSVIVGPQPVGARLSGPNMPTLPASLMGPDDSAKPVAEKQPPAPLVAPAVPEFLKGPSEAEVLKKEKPPEPLPVAPATPPSLLEDAAASAAATPPAPLTIDISAKVEEDAKEQEKKQPPKSGAWHRDL